MQQLGRSGSGVAPPRAKHRNTSDPALPLKLYNRQGREREPARTPGTHAHSDPSIRQQGSGRTEFKGVHPAAPGDRVRTQARRV